MLQFQLRMVTFSNTDFTGGQNNEQNVWVFFFFLTSFPLWIVHLSTRCFLFSLSHWYKKCSATLRLLLSHVSTLTHAAPHWRNFLFITSHILTEGLTNPGPWARTPDPGGAGGSEGKKMRCSTLLALLTGVILYLVMGALVFSALEGPNESKAYEDLLDVKRTFLINETCVTELDFLKLVKVLTVCLFSSPCFLFWRCFCTIC